MKHLNCLRDVDTKFVLKKTKETSDWMKTGSNCMHLKEWHRWENLIESEDLTWKHQQIRQVPSCICPVDFVFSFTVDTSLRGLQSTSFSPSDFILAKSVTEREAPSAREFPNSATWRCVLEFLTHHIGICDGFSATALFFFLLKSWCSARCGMSFIASEHITPNWPLSDGLQT